MSVVKTGQRRALQLFGHVMRMDESKPSTSRMQFQSGGKEGKTKNEKNMEELVIRRERRETPWPRQKTVQKMAELHRKRL